MYICLFGWAEAPQYPVLFPLGVILQILPVTLDQDEQADTPSPTLCQQGWGSDWCSWWDCSYRQSCSDSGVGGKNSSQQGQWRWRLGDGVPAAKPVNHSQANFFTHGLLRLLPSSALGFLSVPVRKPADTLLSSASVHLCGLQPNPWLRGGGTQAVTFFKSPPFSYFFQTSFVAQLVKNPPANVGDLGLIPGLGRPLGEGKGYPLQYFGLENSTDYTVHGVAKSRTPLSNFHFPWWLRQ